jgi:predicted ATP-grasp superfamily ATP-dependent carboligase
MSAEVTIDWEPHYKQREVIESDARIRVLCWGRRTGKNEAAIVFTIRYALEHPDSTVFWVAPTYKKSDKLGSLGCKKCSPARSYGGSRN